MNPVTSCKDKRDVSLVAGHDKPCGLSAESGNDASKLQALSFALTSFRWLATTQTPAINPKPANAVFP